MKILQITKPRCILIIITDDSPIENTSINDIINCRLIIQQLSIEFKLVLKSNEERILKIILEDSLKCKPNEIFIISKNSLLKIFKLIHHADNEYYIDYILDLSKGT